jgi:hypothetical protein
MLNNLNEEIGGVPPRQDQTSRYDELRWMRMNVKRYAGMIPKERTLGARAQMKGSTNQWRTNERDLGHH